MPDAVRPRRMCRFSELLPRATLVTSSIAEWSACSATKRFRLRFADSREAAFIYAVSAAGVAYSVTRACSRGELTDCSCDNRVRARRPNNWQWGGCSEVSVMKRILLRISRTCLSIYALRIIFAISFSRRA